MTDTIYPNFMEGRWAFRFKPTQEVIITQVEVHGIYPVKGVHRATGVKHTWMRNGQNLIHSPNGPMDLVPYQEAVGENSFLSRKRNKLLRKLTK